MSLRTLGSIAFASLVLLSTGLSHAGTFGVPDRNFSSQNLVVAVPGATTATMVTFGNYVTGPGGGIGFERGIVPFPRPGFAPIADGRPLLGARLRLQPTEDFLEPGEVYSTELRLFTTFETDLRMENRDIFAALTGDGGDHTVIGSLELAAGDTAPHTIELPPAALAALEAAIYGDEPTIGIALREFEGDDLLDEFVFGVPPGVMKLEIDVDPLVPPFCEVDSIAPTYRNGDTVRLSRLRFANPDPVTIGIRFRLQLTAPVVGDIEIVDVELPTFPGWFDANLGGVPLFKVDAHFPRGTWSARCAIEDLESGEQLAEDTVSFTLQ